MMKLRRYLIALSLFGIVSSSSVEDIQCCGPDQLLDLDRFQCYDDGLVSSNRTELSIDCSSSGSIKAVPLEEFNQTGTISDEVLYCIHGTTIIMRNNLSLK